MVTKKTTSWEIIFLCNHRRGFQLNPTTISRDVGCSISAVKFWLKKYDETEDVEVENQEKLLMKKIKQ